MTALTWENVPVPFGYGLQQQADDRALQAPALSICRDAEFSSIGGLQTRLPFRRLSNLLENGTPLHDVRRIASHGDELLCWTDEQLYSWSDARARWVLRATHLAAKVEEQSLFTATGEQLDCDRAELNSLIFYCWTDSFYAAPKVYLAAVDKTTGTFVFGPRSIGTGKQTKLVALGTRVMLFAVDDVAPNTFFYTWAIDPTSSATILSSVIAPTTLYTSSPVTPIRYDVERIAFEDRCVVVWRCNPVTQYRIATITAALAISSVSKARPCNEVIAVAVSPTGAAAQVVRGNDPGAGSLVIGDLIDVTIAGFPADLQINEAIGTSTLGTTQIAACYLPTLIGGVAYRCVVFWSNSESASDFGTRVSNVDTLGNVGFADVLARRVGLASRAFLHTDDVFVWVVFASASTFTGANALPFRAQLQNTYFLYRSDALLVAKAAASRAGGYASSPGRLPGVSGLGTTFSWLGNERRIITLGGESHTSYGARVPREITVTFDSNESRRSARIGQTIYVAAGEMLQYDGETLVEVGFHLYPWEFGAVELAAGALAGGVYGYKSTWRWENRRGEIERSTTATVGTVTITTPPNGVDIQSPRPLSVTHKRAQPPAVEIWRTPVNPSADTNFHLVTSKDPNVTANPNRYLANDAVATSLPTVHDVLDDTSLLKNEASPENGLVLEPLSPPACKIILAGADRLFIAGIAGEPFTVRYSKLRGDGEIASFNDALKVELPATTGPITALSMNGEVPAVFTATAVYMLAGDGFGNDGLGSNFVAVRRSDSAGATSQEAVLDTDRGVLFKSRKGWHLLNRGWGVEYVGAPVKDFDAEEVLSTISLADTNEIRMLTSARVLFFDVVSGQWGERTIEGGLHACIWQGRYCYLDPGGVLVEEDDHDLCDYGMDVATAWIKPADLQGYARWRKLQVLGEKLGECRIRVRIAYDYDETYVDDKIIPLAASPVLRIQVGPKRQQATAIKVRLTVVDLETTLPPQGTAAVRFTGISFQVGLQAGLARRVAAAQKG